MRVVFDYASWQPFIANLELRRRLGRHEIGVACVRNIVTSTAPPPLFSAGNFPSAAYMNIRDGVENHGAREFAEKLWHCYFPHADPHFLTEIQRDFHARFWEMYLTCTLLEGEKKGSYRLLCPKPGPDNLLLHLSFRTWVEAVTVTPGDPSKPDSIDPGSSNEGIPADKIILRFASAIRDKVQRYHKYLKQGVVSNQDSYVLAINSWPLGYTWAPGEIPRFLKAIYPLGALSYGINPARTFIDRKYGYRPVAYKKNHAPVATEIFGNSKYAGISAILHSHAHALMPSTLGIDFELAFNPVAAWPITSGLISAPVEWHATRRSAGGYELSREQNRY